MSGRAPSSTLPGLAPPSCPLDPAAQAAAGPGFPPRLNLAQPLWSSAKSPAECLGFPAQSPPLGRTPPPHCLQNRGTALPAPKRPCFPSLYPPPVRPLDSGSAPRRLPESDSAPRRLPDLAPPSSHLFGSGSALIRFLDSRLSPLICFLGYGFVPLRLLAPAPPSERPAF